MKSGLLAVLVAVLIAGAYCQTIPSVCEYNNGTLLFDDDDAENLSFGAFLQKYRERLCSKQTSAADCNAVSFCYWRDTENQNQLADHNTAEFVPPHVTKVNELNGVAVYVAVGYGIANSVLVTGNAGDVLVDTGDSVTSAQMISAAFQSTLGRALNLKAIIYSHSHPDHFTGTSVFVNGTAPGSIPIYSHSTFLRFLGLSSLSGTIMVKRARQMFGVSLFQNGTVGPDGWLSNGIGPQILTDGGAGIFSPILPTKTFDTTLDIVLGNIVIKLIYTPGETDDTIATFLPLLSTVIVGDNFYSAYPNVYTIRGTLMRSAKSWMNSLDTLIKLNSQYLVPCHTNPIIGLSNVKSALTSYRDGIQFVHDQTLLLANQGYSPQTIARTVKLPDYLANSQFLKQFYGFVPYVTRTVFDFYLGWFDGNPANLQPLESIEEAKRIIALGGGSKKVLQSAVSAIAEHSPKGVQWALQLTSWIRKVELPSSPVFKQATQVYLTALTILGDAQPDAPSRNYFLGSAADQTNVILVQQNEWKLEQQVLRTLSVADYLQALTIRLNYQKAMELHGDKEGPITFSIAFTFENDEQYLVQLRRSVLHIDSNPSLEDLNDSTKITINSFDLKDAIAGTIDIHDVPVVASNDTKKEVLPSFAKLFV